VAPAASAPAPPPAAAAATSTAGPRAAAVDGRLIAILEAPLAPGETAASGYRRKEEAIGAVLATLSVPESRALFARLTAAHPGDPLAEKLTRLTVERRHRLLAFLAEARRREALRLQRR
jgi:hypothetical protein